MTAKDKIICPYCKNEQQPTNYIHYACSSSVVRFIETCSKCKREFEVCREIIKKYTTKISDILTGKELEIAVDNGLKVRYIIESDINPEYACDKIVVFCREYADEKYMSTECYSEDGRDSVNLDDFSANEDCVMEIYGGGKMYIKKAEGVEYIEKASIVSLYINDRK